MKYRYIAEKMEDQTELNLPAQYNFTPMRALRMASRRKLSSFLELEGNLVVVNNAGIESDVVNGYGGLAELAGFDYQDIMNMKRQNSPTRELLDLWTTHKNGVLDCKRYEENEQFRMEAERYNIEQDPTVSTSEMKVDETKFATVQDAEDENDRKFVFDMIDEVEKERGLKLFVPGRDDLPGSAEHTITAYLIEKRCKRVVILFTRQFLKSTACDFQVKFAHALAPGTRSKKLIPVARERNTTIPRILRFLAICDMVEWVWDRLYASLIAPVGPVTYFEKEDSSDSFDMRAITLPDIKYPSLRRLIDNEDISNNLTGGGSKTADVFASREKQPVVCSVSSMSWGQPTSDNRHRTRHL